MFKMNDMMRQAKNLQKKMTETQERISQMEFEGHSGAGLVKVIISGNGDVRSIKISPDLLKPEEADMLEDLLVAAFNDAKQKMDKVTSEEMKKVTGGIPLPGGMF